MPLEEEIIEQELRHIRSTVDQLLVLSSDELPLEAQPYFFGGNRTYDSPLGFLCRSTTFQPYIRVRSVGDDLNPTGLVLGLWFPNGQRLWERKLIFGPQSVKQGVKS